MNAIIEHILEEAHSAWRFRWWALITASVLALLGWIVLFMLPDTYEATASVFVDKRTALRPVIENVSVDQSVDAQLNYVQQSLLAGDQLKEIAEQSGVLPRTVMDARKREGILQDLSTGVVLTVEPAGQVPNERESAGTIYRIAYQDRNRARSLRVVDLILNTFVEKTLGGKRQGSEDSQEFLRRRIAEYDAEITKANDRLAEFKRKNVGLLPTAESGGYFTQLDTELAAAQKAQTALSIAVTQRNELRSQLRGESVINASGAGAIATAGGVAGGTDTASRLKSAQAHLDELLLRFTEQHPDVIEARKDIEELTKRRNSEIEALRRGDQAAIAASGAANNPVYQQIQVQLNNIDLQIAQLSGELRQHEIKAADLRKRMDTMPKVEAEYEQLNTGLQSMKDLRAKFLENLQKARVGEQADTAGSVRFSVVQPTRADIDPVFPKRGLFTLLVLLGALAIGGGVAYTMHLIRPVVGSARSLAAFTGLPVIGVVGTAFPQQTLASAKRDLAVFMTSLAALGVAFIVVMALNLAGIRLHSGGG